MNIKKGKSESTLFGTGKMLSKLGTPSVNINVNGNHINFTNSYKYLGIYLDSTLSFNENFDKSYKKASSRVNLLNNIRRSINSYTAECIYKSIIMPVLTYCIAVANSYCNSKQLKMKRIERRSISIIEGNSKNIDVKLPSFQNTIKNWSCMLTFDSIYGYSCEAFQNCFERLDHLHNTRNNNLSPKVA